MPIVIVSFLQGFEGVFLEEIPNGLSLIMGIDYQIGCIPEASIPNWQAYKSNPNETKKL